MARRKSTKPDLHEASGFWCMSQNRQRVYLDKDCKVTCRKMREIRAAEKLESQGVTEWFDSPFAALADEFLEDIKARKPASTYHSYRYRLLRALRVIGTDLRVCEVKKLHLTRLEGTMKGDYTPTTIKDTIAIVQTVFSWAVKHDLTTGNALVGYEKPRGRTRNGIITDSEFKALREHSDVKFRRVLWSLRLTGCRPGEIRSLVWNGWTLTRDSGSSRFTRTVTQQRQPKPRIIHLAYSPCAITSLSFHMVRATLSSAPLDHRRPQKTGTSPKGKPVIRLALSKRPLLSEWPSYGTLTTNSQRSLETQTG